MYENGKLKKGIYRNSQPETLQPYFAASRFQRKRIKIIKDTREEVSPYNTTFEKLPF